MCTAFMRGVMGRHGAARPASSLIAFTQRLTSQARNVAGGRACQACGACPAGLARVLLSRRKESSRAGQGVHSAGWAVGAGGAGLDREGRELGTLASVCGRASW